MSARIDSSPTEQTQVPNLDALTQIAGAALAELGLVAPRESLLEPIAHAIHSLGQPEPSERQQCQPR